ncbi:MAG: FecR domain-containing protein [Pedobacter sp.]|uniref:FecR family protein n=1 Tax=Pedobacter sp. TaxID=1411316 RepID=UPI003396D409
MTKEKLRELLQQYFDNSISKADCKELLDYLDTDDLQEIAPLMDEILFLLPDTAELDQSESVAVYNAIRANHHLPQTDHILKSSRGIANKWYYIAAMVLIALSVSLHFIKTPGRISENKFAASKSGGKSSIQPGSKKATLTLSNGQIIDLEAQQEGILQGTGNSAIRKVRSGQIVYQATQPYGKATQSVQDVALNDLKTPKGGEYQITLADGTKVWLNSASSLRFPAAFRGNRRQVVLNGEAYFEVAKNAAKPFVVMIGATEIKVLGTHFNVSGYQDDDEATTTLLEGSVQLTSGGNTRRLSPGQQAAVSKNSGDILISQGDIAQAMAWKNGYFRFDDQNIRGIMKQVSRWYDVEVEFKQNVINNKQFGGTFYRNKSIAELLRHLEELDHHIHFKINGRRIEIME